jgi:hypothetical protein
MWTRANDFVPVPICRSLPMPAGDQRRPAGISNILLISEYPIIGLLSGQAINNDQAFRAI